MEQYAKGAAMTEFFNAPLHIVTSKDGREVRITTAHQTIVLESLAQVDAIIRMLAKARMQMTQTKGDKNV